MAHSHVLLRSSLQPPRHGCRVSGRVDVADLQAGREMDAAVAEKVMGYAWIDESPPSGRFLHTPEGLPAAYVPLGSDDTTWTSHLPHFSTDIAAAWLVVEHTTRERDWRWEVCVVRGYTHVWLVPIWHAATEADLRAQPDYMADADTAPLAICRASLAAVRGRRNAAT